MDSQVYGAPEWNTPSSVESALDNIIRRLDSILLEPFLTAESFVEITAIFNNASHIFLYLEAKDDHTNFERLLPKRDHLYKNHAIDQRILSKLRAVKFDDPAVERSRAAYVDQLTEKSAAEKYDVFSDQIDKLKADAMLLEADVLSSQRSTLQRIGLPVGDRAPAVVFYHAVSRMPDADVRDKLAKIWAMSGEPERFRIGGIVDQIFDLRRRRALEICGAATPIEVTLRKCKVDANVIEAFLERFLLGALIEHQNLEDEMRTTLNLDKVSLIHFGYFVRQRFGQETVPLFDFEKCLDYIFAIAEEVFELNFSINERSSRVFVADITRSGTLVGRIHFDLWATHGGRSMANHTQGLRNSASWGEIVQLPEAWVSCKFESKDRDGERAITFQDVHSLFHEFGHAINHLMVEEEIPNQSGLEYLPLERLEFLSMWSEKWVYHSAFGKSLELSDDDLRGLELCRVIKKLEYRRTYLERAAIALIDFECHRRSDLTLRGSYEELDAKYDIGRYVSFNDFPQYFIWPMFMANPGANFAYLWGSAWSCEQFGQFEDLNILEASDSPRAPAVFRPCFRNDMPSVVPEPDAIFSFYRTC